MLATRALRSAVYVVGHKLTAGAIVVCHHDGRLLLVKQRLGEGRWGLPGGLLKSREQPVDCAVREFREETGLELQPGRLRLLDAYVQPFAWHLDTVFQLLDPGRLADPESRTMVEVTDARWWPVSGLPPLRREARLLLARHPGLIDPG